MNKYAKKKVIILSIALVILIISTYISVIYNVGIKCINYKLTGFYCPGCGMTRAVQSLFKLDFYQAIRYNVFSIILLPVLGIYLIGEIYSWLTGKFNLIENIIPKQFWILMMVLMLLYGILRNISLFSYLAPTTII